MFLLSTYWIMNVGNTIIRNTYDVGNLIQLFLK